VKKLAPAHCGVGAVTLVVDLELPKDAHINPDVASQIEIVRGRETTVAAVEALPVETVMRVSEGETELTIKTAVYWCRDGQAAVCCYSMETYVLTLTADSGGPDRISLIL
jgi:hypothetical protein